MKTKTEAELGKILRRVGSVLGRLVSCTALAWGVGSLAEPSHANAAVDFAQSVAVGHFNRVAANPGMDDVAIGNPLESGEAGSVTVWTWDTAGGTRTRVKLTQAFLRDNFQITSGVSSATIDTTTANDHFGAALATGDFNSDGLSDLAIGVPDEDVKYGTNVIIDSGYVHVLYGTSGSGWAGTPFQQKTRILPNPFLRVPGTGDLGGEQFGFAVAVSKFNRDTVDDLAVGVPGAHGFSTVSKGMVYFYRGGPGTASAPIGTLDTSSTSLIENPSGQGDQEAFGFSLAAGNFYNHPTTASTPRQIAIGAPNGLIPAGNVKRAGFVFVFDFVASLDAIHPNLSSSRFYSQEIASPATGGEKNEAYDHFGHSIAAVPMGGSDDPSALLVGAPYEDAGLADVGVVHFFSPANLVPPQIIYSDTFGVPVQAKAYFGRSVAGGLLRQSSASPPLMGAIIGEPGRNSNTGAAYHFGETATARQSLSLLESWTSIFPAVEDRFGEVVTVGTPGPSESPDQVATTVGKGYVGVPGAKKVMQFNVGVTSSGKNQFRTP